jgi:hypothetical protein
MRIDPEVLFRVIPFFLRDGWQVVRIGDIWCPSYRHYLFRTFMPLEIELIASSSMPLKPLWQGQM